MAKKNTDEKEAEALKAPKDTEPVKEASDAEDKVPGEEGGTLNQNNLVKPEDDLRELSRKADNQAEVERFVGEHKEANKGLSAKLRDAAETRREIAEGKHGSFAVGNEGERVTR